jgi:SAM-dependent methyltransferase
MLHEDRDRAGSFGQDAERYDRARPNYPEALFDDLLGTGPVRVLDVGCGTGIAARQLAGRGCDVLGVEPDPRMAAVARRYGLAVEESAFEAWEPAGRQFDLVTSGQAWHWVDPVAGAAKAAQALVPGGLVGLFWNHGQHEPADKAAIDAVYARHVAGLDAYSFLLGYDPDDRVRVASSALAADGSFRPPERRTFTWERTYTTAEWLDQLPTHSDHNALGPERLASILTDLGHAIEARGGCLVMHYTAWLVRAERR